MAGSVQFDDQLGLGPADDRVAGLGEGEDCLALTRDERPEASEETGPGDLSVPDVIALQRGQGQP